MNSGGREYDSDPLGYGCVFRLVGQRATIYIQEGVMLCEWVTVKGSLYEWAVKVLHLPLIMTRPAADPGCLISLKYRSFNDWY